MDKHQTRVYLYQFKLRRSTAENTRNINVAFGKSLASDSRSRYWFGKFETESMNLENY